MNRLQMLLVSGVTALLTACSGSSDSSNSPPNVQQPTPNPLMKPYPKGIFTSLGGAQDITHNLIGNHFNPTGSNNGVLLFVPWNLCDDVAADDPTLNETECLLNYIEAQIVEAESEDWQVALIVADSKNIPISVKNKCEIFPYVFREVNNETTCLPWDLNYLEAKKNLIKALGARFDSREALAYVYFTGACSSNGNEGHCRFDETAFTAAGYTPEKLTNAYLEIMQTYHESFPTTPITFEVHTIFGETEPWETIWQTYKNSKHLGVAAWWCAERLAENSRSTETYPMWSLIQDAAATTFTVCQPVASISATPFEFSDALLGLDYGIEDMLDTYNSALAFTDLMDWIEGKSVPSNNPNQTAILRFSVMEAWANDSTDNSYTERLKAF